MTSQDDSRPDVSVTVEAEFDNVLSRRRRKREVDRRSQRQARQKKKSRLAYLEDVVTNIEQQEDEDGRVSALVKQVSRLSNENHALSQTIHEIQNIVSTYTSPVVLAQAVALRSSVSKGQNEAQIKDIAAHPTEIFPGQSDNVLPETQPQSTPLTKQFPSKQNPCAYSPNSLDSQTISPESVFEIATCELSRCISNSETSQDNELYFDDILVRGVMEGWQSVDATIQMTDTWKTIRHIDENLWSTASQTERLVVFYLTYHLIQYYRNPTPRILAKLPLWYGQRFGQISTSCVEANFLPWPGLRQKWMTSPHRYRTQRFWLACCQCFQFQWPYETRDTFLQRRDTGRYEISPMFVDSITDIGRLSMRPDFFILFPDLRADMPTASSIPKSLTNMVQLRQPDDDPKLLRKHIEH